MIITNQYDLPSPIVAMAQQDSTVEEGVYRVTSLLKGVRECLLSRRHEHEITVDCANMIWLLFGTAVHGILEKQQSHGQQETRLNVPIDGYTLSGQFDLYENDTVIDYKTTSIWKVIKKDYEDYKKQLLIYAWMLRQHGEDPQAGQVIALLKDHSRAKARFDKSYPQLPVQKTNFAFTETDFTSVEQFLHERFALIKKCEALADDALPICTESERFNDGNRYAVMQHGKKRALRVLPSESAAAQWMANNRGDFIEQRLGEDKKCKEYCNAAQFCSYYKERGYGELKPAPPLWGRT